jgi:hypothetical protein
MCIKNGMQIGEKHKDYIASVYMKLYFFMRLFFFKK